MFQILPSLQLGKPLHWEPIVFPHEKGNEMVTELSLVLLGFPENFRQFSRYRTPDSRIEIAIPKLTVVGSGPLEGPTASQNAKLPDRKKISTADRGSKPKGNEISRISTFGNRKIGNRPSNDCQHSTFLRGHSLPLDHHSGQLSKISQPVFKLEPGPARNPPISHSFQATH